MNLSVNIRVWGGKQTNRPEGVNMDKLSGHRSEIKFLNHRVYRGGHASKARGAAKRAFNRANRREGKKACRF